MHGDYIEIEWANGVSTWVKEGENWIIAAQQAGFKITTGCLGGSCGACEIEVNGEIVRACISNVEKNRKIKVDIVSDPYW